VSRDDVLFDPIKGHGHGHRCLKVVKWPISMSLSANVHRIATDCGLWCSMTI